MLIFEKNPHEKSILLAFTGLAMLRNPHQNT